LVFYSFKKTKITIYNLSIISNSVEITFHLLYNKNIALFGKGACKMIEIVEWMKLILNSLSEGVLITDKDSNVIYVNDAYTKITGVEYNNIVGKPLLSVRKGAQLPIVLKTGKEILRAFRKEGDIEYFVNMYPIILKEKIIGGISIVTAIDDAYYLSEKISQLREKNRLLLKALHYSNNAKYTFNDIVAESKLSLKTKELAMKVAKTDSPVLLQAETGCGKELYAQAIHNSSSRKNGPFIAINCATLSPDLLESELFGYEEGAFTGAKKNGKTGLFEMANNGTLFLDEISEIEYSLQAKLLRVLQEQTIRKIGGNNEIKVNVRIICACNVDLLKYTNEGKFRKDLYFRISTFPIFITPLRERKEDILPLTESILKNISINLKRNIQISPDALNVLMNYNWPGNIRELKNVLEFSATFAQDGVIQVEHLPEIIHQGVLTSYSYNTNGKTLAEKVKEFEKSEIKKALNLFGDTVEGKKKAAKYLGISLASLYNKINN